MTHTLSGDMYRHTEKMAHVLTLKLEGISRRIPYRLVPFVRQLNIGAIKKNASCRRDENYRHCDIDDKIFSWDRANERTTGGKLAGAAAVVLQ